MSLPRIDEVRASGGRRGVRHEAFLNQLEAGGVPRPPIAAGLRLLRFLDSWVELGPSIMRGDAPVLQLREGVDGLPSEWADLRGPLLVAYDALAFIGGPDVAPEAPLSTAQVRGAWMRAVIALADAADAYETHRLPSLTVAMYTAILERLPPTDQMRAARRAKSVEQLAERARTALARLTV